MKKIIYLALTAAVSLTLIQSCSKSDGGAGNNNNNGSSFDQKAMLTNISTNIIIPAYTSYQAATVSLDAAVTTFNTTSNAANLTALQNAFITTYKQWQSTSIYDFGPAADASLRVNTNTYPADVNQISANVTAGTYDPQLLANLSAKGLPALDYLLFNTTSDNAAVLALYTSDSKAANRKTYLAALSAELKTNAAKVLSAWTGSYKNTFINATGTSASSSVSYLVNQLIYDYEVLKNFEIGIPAGSQSLGATFPTKVQAYYSKISLQLTKLHLQAIQNLYLGASGSGLDDYVIAVNGKTSTGGSLDAAIKAQFTAATAKLQTLSDPLSANIISNPTAVLASYTELQKLTVILKNDMTSALGVAISFGDNDGD
jgi:predicted lipoprotein